MSQVEPILIVGAGHYGVCLAVHAASLGHQVILQTRTEDDAESINRKRHPRCFFESLKLSATISAQSEQTADRTRRYSAIIWTVPAQNLREALKVNKHLSEASEVNICAAKGIETSSLALPLEMFEQEWGASEHVCFLSGPSFAAEVVEGKPTAVSVASSPAHVAIKAQKLLHSPSFRIYTSDDPIGLELAGALKNVMAIAAGAAQGLRFGASAGAAMTTRALAEIRRFGAAFGAEDKTFLGLGGVGDLFLTCSSTKSRNFRVGYALGQGSTAEEAIEAVKSTAEGVATTQAVYQLARNYKLSTPIIDAVYSVLYEDESIENAVRDLLTREPKAEN